MVETGTKISCWAPHSSPLTSTKMAATSPRGWGGGGINHAIPAPVVRLLVNVIFREHLEAHFGVKDELIRLWRSKVKVAGWREHDITVRLQTYESADIMRITAEMSLIS